tara:strand:+ start:74 stop:337 length:264 start_codon:yes stop_codon:yes gene_type:complete
MFKNIDKIISQLFIQKQKKEYESFLFFKKKWEKTISKTIQKNAKIIDYSNKKLIIKTETPAWKNELFFLKKEIKKNFQIQKIQLTKL